MHCFVTRKLQWMEVDGIDSVEYEKRCVPSVLTLTRGCLHSTSVSDEWLMTVFRLFQCLRSVSQRLDRLFSQWSGRLL